MCCRSAMALPRNEQGPQRLHLENSFEDNGVSGQQVLVLLTLENDVSQRCLSAQLAPTALQTSNGLGRGNLSRLSQHCRGTTDASVLTSCATSPLLLICRPTVCSSLSSCWT